MGSVMAVGGVSAAGLVMQSYGAAISSSALLTLSGVAGLIAAVVGAMCARRMYRLKAFVHEQNSWRPGDPHPLAIDERDPALDQAFAVEDLIAKLQKCGRERNRRMVARVSSATANRINNALTVVLGSLEIAEHRGFGSKFNREIQGIRDGVEDIRAVCSRLLVLATANGRHVRRVELGSHLRDLEPLLHSAVSSNMNTLMLEILDEPIRVQASPKKITDWLVRSLEIIQRQCRRKTAIRLVARHGDGDQSQPIIEFKVRQKTPFNRVPSLENGAAALGARVEQISDGNGNQVHRLVFPGVEFRQLAAVDGQAPDSDDPNEPGTVLLVEDDEQVRKLLSWMLERRGNRIVEQGNGKDAWSFMEHHGGSVRFAIIDLVIPGIDGVELADRIRQRYPEVGILLVTGNDVEEVREVIRHDSGITLLQKPFGEVDLEEALAGIDHSQQVSVSGII